MATRIKQGHTTWGLDIDNDGIRTYTITFLVIGDKTDGPYNAVRTVGLPRNGDIWSFLGDTDQWAFCTAYRRVKQRASEGPNTQFEVEFKFTNLPVKKCQDVQIDNPLLERMKIAGSYVKYMEEGINDRFEHPIVSSSWERLRGQQNEWDANRAQITIEQNVLFLELELFSWLIDCVNDRQMWGLRERCIKLSSVTWEERYYGQCFKYFNRKFTFDVNAKSWDRDLQDTGTKVLKGHWTAEKHWKLERIAGERPNSWNPGHFIAATDYKGNPINVVLNGRGLPAGVCVDDDDPVAVASDDTIYYVQWGGIAGLTCTGVFPADIRFWVKRTGAPIPTILFTPPWVATTTYAAGEIIKRNGVLYIALSKSFGVDPEKSVLNWASLPTGLTDRGAWSPLNTYSPGDYVRANTIGSAPATGTGSLSACTVTGIGKIHVEKYLQANLFILGVPAIIGH